MNTNQAVKMMSQITGKSRKEIKEDINPVLEAFEEVGVEGLAKNLPSDIINLYLYGSELTNKDYYFNLLDVRNFLIKEFNLRGIQADSIILNNGKVDHWLLIKLAAYRILDEEYPKDEFDKLKVVIEYYLNDEKDRKENYFNEYKKAINAWKKQIKGITQILNDVTKSYDKDKLYLFDKQEIEILENHLSNLCEQIKELNEDIVLSSLNSRYSTVIL
jgi:hypothetical protein